MRVSTSGSLRSLRPRRKLTKKESDFCRVDLRNIKLDYVLDIVQFQSRLRPVMMASLTTILGMIPLLSDAMF